jgi:energy-coupling factor transport system ATP-binding protein
VIARLDDVTYHYPGVSAGALNNVSFGVEPGELLLLAGPSAGGKSTLLRTFNGLVPQFYGGSLRGHMRVDGADPARTPARDMARIAGMVFQEPEAQGIGATVEDDVAFGMEQFGVERREMKRRLDSLLERFSIGHLRGRALDRLSGGERQRAAIAAAMALEPPILLCDEPTSQLDPQGAATVAEAIERLAADGTTVLLAEHRLERFLDRADGVVAVEGGTAERLEPRDAAARLAGVPPYVELVRRLGFEAPLSLAEARTRLTGVEIQRRIPPPLRAPGDVAVSLEGVGARFGEIEALRDVSLTVRAGELVALVGPNGSGKTTLLRSIAGLVRATTGTVCLGGAPAGPRVQERSALAGLVPQDPAVALFEETVAAEVATGLRHRSGAQPNPRDVLERWGIAALAGRNPRDLSVGQQLRVAIAAMLAHAPRVWLMDEPTRGADAAARSWIAGALRQHADSGGAAIVATHDVEAAALFATRVVGLDGGEIAFDMPGRDAFSAKGPHPTGIAQAVPWAVTLEDFAW